MASNGEFKIIEDFFTRPVFGAWHSQGVGDDCAIVDTGRGRMAITSDMMAITTHFMPDADPQGVGYKALAVNLSDLAAAGSTPRAFFLSIGLPEKNDRWLAGFSKGLMQAATEAGCSLMGGDTTKTPKVGGTHSPVVISITAIGELPDGLGLTRAGARPGDDIWVTGDIGGAYAALKHRWGHWQIGKEFREAAFSRMDRPSARYVFGQRILRLATACADISDGFAQDLGHILERSGVDATVCFDALPAHASLAGLGRERTIEAVMGGGDDYELVFTAPANARADIEKAAAECGVPVSRVGSITAGSSHAVTLVDGNGSAVPYELSGFDHFA